MTKPAVITMGDAAGIGPEIIVKLFARKGMSVKYRPVVIGDLIPMLDAQRRISRKVSIRPIKSINEAQFEEGVIDLIDLKRLKQGDYYIGEPSAAAGRASFAYIKEAVRLCLSKKAGAMVTAPITKKTLHMAGLNYPGHTEIIAKMTKAKKHAMMLLSGDFRVVLVTIHTSIKNVPKILTLKNIHETIQITHESLKRDFGIKNPRIAVPGLNPHAGESGAFGKEEELVIAPAIKLAQKHGINAEGPFPPDTIFHRVVKEKSHDAVVCMYHDQGLIPLKLTGFENGVNTTLGLPIVRTSPDHGTAYDIAGTGAASDESLLSALETASIIARNRTAR